jgi:hypothetical protein
LTGRTAAALAPCTGPLELSSETQAQGAAVRWRGAGCSGRFEISGQVRWDSDMAPNWLAPGAYVRGEEEVDGLKRQVAMRPGTGGAPVVDWWLEGEEQPFDDAARAWLAEHLLLFLRQTGFQAEQRVAGLLDQGGVEALLGEVEALNNDRVESLYLAAALRRDTLTTADEGRLLLAGSRLISSDADLADLLVAAVRRPGSSDATLEAVAAAAGSVGSDADRCRALSAGLAAATTSPARSALLSAAAGVRSDGDLADLLTASVGRLDADDAAERQAFAGAVGAIASDGDKARVLTALAGRADLPAPALAMLLDSASAIASDGDLARLLTTVAQRHALPGELREAYLRTAAGIASQADRQRALDAL